VKDLDSFRRLLKEFGGNNGLFSARLFWLLLRF
jgi:hypothetical protein